MMEATLVWYFSGMVNVPVFINRNLEVRAWYFVWKL